MKYGSYVAQSTLCIARKYPLCASATMNILFSDIYLDIVIVLFLYQMTTHAS